MIKGKITNYGLYGYNPLTITTDFIKVERLETTSSPHDWLIKPHIHTDLFQLFLIEHGETVLFLTNKEIVVNNPSVIVMPSNTLHGFNFSPDVQGYVITISDNFVENTLKQAFDNQWAGTMFWSYNGQDKVGYWNDCKCELLNFYLERKDTANAIYWANSITNMPVKIPSKTTSSIQQNVKEILLKLNR